MEEGKISYNDVELFYQRFMVRSNNRTKDIILIIPGRSEFTEMYHHVANYFLASLKMDIFLYDLRGQ